MSKYLLVIFSAATVLVLLAKGDGINAYKSEQGQAIPAGANLIVAGAPLATGSTEHLTPVLVAKPGMVVLELGKTGAVGMGNPGTEFEVKNALTAGTANSTWVDSTTYDAGTSSGYTLDMITKNQATYTCPTAGWTSINHYCIAAGATCDLNTTRTARTARTAHAFTTTCDSTLRNWTYATGCPTTGPKGCAVGVTAVGGTVMSSESQARKVVPVESKEVTAARQARYKALIAD